ncbi:hypothetical protein QCA50_006250 [Cerrena zonata]|uniref:trimethyllysine dioxygenase n=1 Tax=Cerrena zonata TaxID=2478898 RepID=A0AAW0GF28_9APHY
MLCSSSRMISNPARRIATNPTRTISAKLHSTLKHASITQTKHRSLYTITRPRAAAAALKPVPNLQDSTSSEASTPLHDHDLPVSRIDERKVVVGFTSGEWCRYHHIWLRDHCRCSECFHSITKQRLVNTFDIPPDVKPVKVESKSEGLEVTWPTGPSVQPHISLYPWSWLRHNSYDPPLKREDTHEKILWGAKIAQSPPTVSYEEVMESDDNGVFKWLSNVDKFGFSFVSGVPATTEATEELVQRIGFIRETQYGKFWDFTSDLAKGDTAYTTMALAAHTDNTYFTDPCGLQLFHLLSHTKGTGGSTLLVDGFYVASLLKELHPSAYDILSRVGVPAHAAGELSSIYTPTPQGAYPVLRQTNGELVQVRWNNDDRSVMNGLSASELEEWYDAVRLWNKFLT